jgi:septum site-determining protein MinD
LPYNVFHINTFVTLAYPAAEKVIFIQMKISIGETMGDIQGPAVSKHWDKERGRMTLLVRNGSTEIGQVVIEDDYPEAIAGVLCFARSGSTVPDATASGGKITWKPGGMKPGELRELVYTALLPATINDPAARKQPVEKDRALLEASKDKFPRLIVGQDVTPPEEVLPKIVSSPEPRPVIPPVSPDACHKEDIACRKGAIVISVGAGKGGTG